MDALRVIVDIHGRRLEPMMTPASFEVDGKRAVAVFERFPIDPVAIDRVEVVNGVRWIAKTINAEVRNDTRSVRLYLEKIEED